jgi:hypothetical protein
VKATSEPANVEATGQRLLLIAGFRYRVSTPIPDTSGKTSDGLSEMLASEKQKAEDSNIVKSLNSNFPVYDDR